MNRLFNRRTTVLLGLTIFLMAFVAVYTSRLSQRSRATQPKVVFSFTPTGGSFGVNQEKSLEVLIQPEDSTKKISGIDVTFLAEGNAKISDVSAPASFPGGDTSLFTEVIKEISDQKAHISYVSLKPEAQLPGVVKVTVSFKGSQTGGGKIKVDPASTQIVGNISGNSYDLGSLGEGNFNFTGISVEPTLPPVLTPIPTVPETSSCLSLPSYDTFDLSNVSDIWNLWNTENGLVSAEGGKLVTSLGADLIGGDFTNPYLAPNHAGLITKQKVCGDFDASVEFSEFTASGQNNQIAVLAAENLETNSGVYIELIRNSAGKLSYQTDVRRNGTWTGLKSAAAVNTYGQLRIRRQGSVFSVYYNDAQQAGWKLLGTYYNGFNSEANVLFGVGGAAPDYQEGAGLGSVYTNISAKFDNFNLTQAIPDPTFTPAPSGTPAPTPSSGEDKYVIDIGLKQGLVINIGAGEVAQIRFKAKLSSVQKLPDMYLKLRVKDELAFMDTNFVKTLATSDSCNTTPNNAFDFWVPVKANSDGVYMPVTSIGTPPEGIQVATVLPDGWVMLPGVSGGKYYSFYLKGPKTRSTKTAEHIQLQPNEKLETQDFDWTATTLDAGDLPDPNNGLRQDCTVNSIDISLISSRLAKTDAENLNIADVNYDGVISGNDISKVVNTLSTKPDDDQ